MKVEVKEVENKGFKPFKIEIEIETLEELKDLHNRMNVSESTVNERCFNNWCDGHNAILYKIMNKQISKYI